MSLKLSKFSVVATIMFGFAASGASVACSGVNDYPPAGQGGMQQGEGGNTTASGGSNNGSGGSNNGSGGSNNGSGGSNNGSGGSNNGSGGSNNGSGGSNNGSGGNTAKGGGTSTGTGGGTSTGTGGGTSTGASFASVQAIVTKSCGPNGCHSSGGTAPNLSTTGATLYGTLTSTGVSRCSNQKLANAGNASMSALVMVVTGKCGTLKMPLGCGASPCIPQADVDTISSWINAGAKQQ